VQVDDLEGKDQSSAEVVDRGPSLKNDDRARQARPPADEQASENGSAPRWSIGNQALAARPASPPCLEEQPVSFAGPADVILDGFHEVFADGHGLLPLLIASTAQARKVAWQLSASAAGGR
jgi:hypothetical protein